MGEAITEQQAIAELRKAMAAMKRDYTPREKFDRKLPMTDGEWAALPQYVRNRNDREKWRAKPSPETISMKSTKWFESMPDLPPLKGKPIGKQAWRDWCAATYVINLDRRPDRMDAFTRGLPTDWPLPAPQRIAAVDGSKVPTPAGWRSGGGAYGLYSTYRWIIERAITEGCDRPIVLLEDDAVFVPDFARRFGAAMANVPEDFDAVWIGGQHRGRKIPHADGVVRATAIHRTHAWIIHPRFFKPVLKIWQEHWGHVDHAITACCSRFRILALDPFLAAQSGGKSDINGKVHGISCWDGRTGKLFREAGLIVEAPTYNAGAKIGDLIYCLPILRHAGGAHLRYSKRIADGYPPDGMYRLLAPLLEMQPYIRSFGIGWPANGIDLEHWRWKGGKRTGKSLAAHYAEHAGANDADYQTPWLTVDEPDRRSRVIINRTPRYNNNRFPWRRVLEQYKGDIAFVGTEQEHRAFVSTFGDVPRIETANFLDIARLLAGAELFIGNQSSVYAVAEGLKMNTVQEVCVGNADCLFERPNAVYGWNEAVDLPVLL